MGDVKAAEVLAPPEGFAEKDVISCGGAWLVLLTGAGGLCIAESAMYVSRHFAVDVAVSL
jgi:hypothetical protein